MAFGNYNNNQGNQKGKYSPTVLSQIAFSNTQSTVDTTRLAVRFWNNSMMISIYPKAANSTPDQPSFDTKNGITIYLNHHKARMFYEVLDAFLKDPEKYDECGVPSGSALITVSTGRSHGSKGPLIIIRRVNEEGAVVSSFAYEIKSDYYFAVMNYKEGTTFDKKTFPMIELEELRDCCRDYAACENRAIAYSVVDALNYPLDRVNNRLIKIGEKLGVDLGFQSSGNGGGNYQTSFFNRPSSSSSDSSSGGMDDEFGGPAYTSATLDDIE